VGADNPILNNPYEEPRYHYATNDNGEIDYEHRVEGRRIFLPDAQAMPVKRGPQRTMWEANERADELGDHLINLMRKEVGDWRAAGYPAGTVTRVSKELLDFWFANPDRHFQIQLFFAQREAIETAIWLNEVAPKSNVGQHVLASLQTARQEHMAHGGPSSVLPRIAFKMATGTGKTVVMGALILYHFFNRREYRQDTRFADYFLIVTPGVTIKNRLGVLRSNNTTDLSTQDYYHARYLVPPNRQGELDGLNSRLVITNFHKFEPQNLKGNKRSPMDGKRDADGNKQEAKEDFVQVAKRLLGSFKPDSRLLILNDEAHHCYLPKEKGRAVEGEDTREENARAAVWFSGLVKLAERYKVGTIYDLSATPYYLTGSGFEPYSLFPWAVSDFGLTEAIESGLVKIPFLPESDNTQELTEPVLKNLYEHVKKDLSPAGRKTLKSRAKQEGKAVAEEPPHLPPKLQAALDMLHKHYAEDFPKRTDLFGNPPVLIAVCNNTAVSKEVYKHIAGYEYTDENGELRVFPGKFALFSNYDPVTLQPVPKPPTLLIDSDALEQSDQVDEKFKKVFAREIELFKRDYSRIHGSGAAAEITDAEILREVVNTVGKTGMLGAHVRCVVSVSMLTEGWDANTVTHIMGLRAFNSQLLCEQVAGRALRRKNYELVPHDRNGNIVDPKTFKGKIDTWKFPPEYAQIIGIPFKTYKPGTTTTVDGGERVHVHALEEREEYEITFPNVVGYRVEHKDAPIQADFSAVEPFVFDASGFPIDTVMASAFSSATEELTARDRLAQLRDQELTYKFSQAVLSRFYQGEDGQPEFHRFAQVKRVVDEWYQLARVIGFTGGAGKRVLYYEDADRICSHINRCILSASAGTDVIRPVLNYYRKFDSTQYVNAFTTKEVYATEKSHVNFVVADTEQWEQIAAKALDDPDLNEVVISYVKNAYLGFTIPYVDALGEDRLYYPDFIARCHVSAERTINLIIEITGMNKDKAEKRWYVEHRWLPAVNSVREKYGYDEWQFIEIAGDIRDIKNEIIAKVREG
jgi:type III restriction enzyme